MSLILQRRGLVDEYNGYQFRRESMAQDSVGKLIYPHNARFEQGPFGSDKAILVEEGTENLITSDKNMIKPIGTSTILIVEGGLPVGQYTISFDYDVAGETVPEGFLLYAFGKRALGTIPVIGLKGTTFLTFEVAEDVANTTVRLYGDISHATSLNKKVTFTNLQIEAKPYATTFTPSIRESESLTVPIEGILSPEQGTIELWYNDNGINKNKIVFKCGDLKFNPVSVTEGWHLISVIWDGVDTNYYIDKELVSTTIYPTELGSLYLGSDGDIDFINSLISHLRLSSIARTADQLAPLDAPPTVDEYTTLYLPFNGPDNVRAAKVVTL